MKMPSLDGLQEPFSLGSISAGHGCERMTHVMVGRAIWPGLSSTSASAFRQSSHQLSPSLPLAFYLMSIPCEDGLSPSVFRVFYTLFASIHSQTPAAQMSSLPLPRNNPRTFSRLVSTVLTGFKICRRACSVRNNE